MPVVTMIAIYFVLWWLCLFLVLPWGIRGQHEDGDVVEGTEPGAPIRPRLLKKAVQTTILTFIIWGIVIALIKFDLLSIDNIPLLPDFVPEEI